MLAPSTLPLLRPHPTHQRSGHTFRIPGSRRPASLRGTSRTLSNLSNMAASLPDVSRTSPPYRCTKSFFSQDPPRNVPDGLESSGEGVPPAMREYAAVEPTGQDGGREALIPAGEPRDACGENEPAWYGASEFLDW